MKNEILEELFLLDPEFKKHEAKLKKIMDELIKQKPDSKFDEAFKEELKLKLLSHAEEIMGDTKNDWFKDLFTIKAMSYSLTGVVLTLLISVPVFVTFISKDSETKKFSFNSTVKDQTDTEKIFESGITKMAANAFGEFAADAQNISLKEEAQEVAGLGGGGEMAAAVGRAETLAVSDDAPAAKMIMPYEPYYYKYTYNGEEFSLNQDKLLVFRKNKEKGKGVDVDRVLKQFDLGEFDLNQFSNLKVRNLNLLEDKEFGFSFNIDFQNNLVSLYKDWNSWPRVDEHCRDAKCFDQYRLKPDDVPNDQKIIKVADDFVKKLGIDMDFYGEAVVEDHWKNMLTRDLEEKDIWVPEEMTVIYPLQLDDQFVYDYGGNEVGLSVNVNIRHMRASGIQQVGSQKYEASEYEAITSVDKVMKSLENGGFMNYQRPYDNGENVREVTISLGSPNLDLIRYYHYDNSKLESEELYLPALIFPVESISDTKAYYSRKAIVVPLVKEFLEENDDAVNPVPRPMPLLESAVIKDDE